MTTLQDIHRQYETLLMVMDVAEIRCEGDLQRMEAILREYGYPEMVQDFVSVCLENQVDYNSIRQQYVRKKN